MNFALFSDTQQPTYRIVLLIKESYFEPMMLRRYYVDPLVQLGFKEEDIIAIKLPYAMGKFNSKLAIEHLLDIRDDLIDLKVEFLLCADAKYFTKVTAERKAEPFLGYLMDCNFPGLEALKVVYTLNYGACVHQPESTPKIKLALNCLASYVAGTHVKLGTDIIHFEEYPSTYAQIKQWLIDLLDAPELTCDIEGFSLSLGKTGIATIGFAWSKHEGIAFACDYSIDTTVDGMFGAFVPNPTIRALLKEFFQNYKGKLKFHNANFDCRNLILHLFMDNPLDIKGKIEGIKIFTRDMDDTMLIAYLATNSSGESPIGLKPLAHEFAGTWAVDDIKDIRKIPLDKLLRYNLVDCLCTHFVYEKYHPIMVAEQQESLYKTLFLPTVKYIMQMELTGLPVNMKRVLEVEQILLNDKQVALTKLMGHAFINECVYFLKEQLVEKKHKLWKKKRTSVDEVVLEFNPNSDQQLQVLLYEIIGLPVIDVTDSGAPSVGKKTIDKLMHHTKSAAEAELLQALVEYADVEKILTSFLPAFKDAFEKDGWHYLHGSFRVGGTLSGRLSSSNP